MGELRIGVSGWSYPEWRGTFYPKGLVQRRELEYVSSKMNSAEINGSFYSLQSPASYKKWAAATPDGFIFALKGSKFITHNKKLTNARVPLANFFASGVLALGDKLGPILWQFAPWFKFDPEVISEFLGLLPRTTRDAAQLSNQNTISDSSRTFTESAGETVLRYAFEPRHESFFNQEFVELLAAGNHALAIAETGGKWTYAEDITADFMYIRLHGEELYLSDYSEKVLDRWADRINAWRKGAEPVDAVKLASRRPVHQPRDVYVYFDNTMAAHAPLNAISLAQRLDARMAKA